MLAVRLTNTALSPLAYRLHQVLPNVVKPETQYAIILTCRCVDETHLRPLLLAAVSQAHAILQALHSEDESARSRTRLRADITMTGHRSEEVEQIAMSLSLEPGVTSPRLVDRSSRNEVVPVPPGYSLFSDGSTALQVQICLRRRRLRF
jgi:hypothetical protein